MEQLTDPRASKSLDIFKNKVEMYLFNMALLPRVFVCVQVLQCFSTNLFYLLLLPYTFQVTNLSDLTLGVGKCVAESWVCAC